MTTLTIPADDFVLDGDRAWWIVDVDGQQGADFLAALIDRPCDTCGGECKVWLGAPRPGGGVLRPCPADCIAGRHTWNIQVEQEMDAWIGSGGLVADVLSFVEGNAPRGNVGRFRVSVVRGMGAVPIVEGIDRDGEQRIIVGSPGILLGTGYWLTELKSGPPREITLPSGARPGRFAALLNVQRIAS